MSLALERVCETLDLRVQDDPATRLMAKKIIELAQRGVRGDALSSAALKEFKYKNNRGCRFPWEQFENAAVA